MTPLIVRKIVDVNVNVIYMNKPQTGLIFISFDRKETDNLMTFLMLYDSKQANVSLNKSDKYHLLILVVPLLCVCRVTGYLTFQKGIQQ